MKFFTVLGIIFYTAAMVAIGILLIAVSLSILQPQDIIEFFSAAQYNAQSRMITGLTGLLLILTSLSFAQLIIGKYQREKTIAFTTSSGEVTIALSAIEDLIKRLAVFTPEIKELRPDVIATKKGIIVDLRVILKSEANIPDLTGRLQEITRSKIQEVLGVEEQIIIKIHVAKIISSEEKKRKDSAKDEEPSIPFSGYSRT